MVVLLAMRVTQDLLINQLREVSQAKPRNKNDDAILAEITRIESELALARDDLVSLVLCWLC